MVYRNSRKEVALELNFRERKAVRQGLLQVGRKYNQSLRVRINLKDVQYTKDKRASNHRGGILKIVEFQNDKGLTHFINEKN